MELIFRVLEVTAVLAPALASVVAAAWWPAAVVTIVLLFKEPLRELINRTESVEAPGVKIRAQIVGAAREARAEGARPRAEQLTGDPASPVESEADELPPQDEGVQHDSEQVGSSSLSQRVGNSSKSLLAARNAVNAVQVIKLQQHIELIELGAVQYRVGVMNLRLDAIAVVRELGTSAALTLGHSLTAEYHEIMSEDFALQVLKDGGIVGPGWMNAWFTLRRTYPDVISGHRGIGEVEALTWASTAYDLVDQAHKSLLLVLDRKLAENH